MAHFGLIGGLGAGAAVCYCRRITVDPAGLDLFGALHGMDVVRPREDEIGTDLNLVFSEADAGFPAVDCAAAHIGAIVDRMTEQALP